MCREVLAAVALVGLLGMPAVQAKQLPNPVWYLEGHDKSVRLVAVHPDGEVVASAADGEIRFWSLSEKKHLHTINEWPRSVGSLTYSHDGTQLIVTTYPRYSFDKESIPCVMSWYDTKTRRKVRSLSFKGPLGPVVLSPNGKLLATASGHPKDCVLTLCDPATGKVLREFRPPPYKVLTFTPDSKRIVTGTYDGKVGVWDIATSKEVLSCKLDTTKSHLSALAVSPGGKTLVASTRDQMTFFDLATGMERAKTEEPWGCNNCNCLLFVRGGAWLLTGLHGAVGVINPRTGKRLFGVNGSLTKVEAIDVSLDNEWLVTAGGGDHNLRAWKLSDW